MSRRKIHIENLQIRLPKNSGLSALETASELGGEILRQIAETTRYETGTRRIEKIDAGKIQMSGDSQAVDLRRRIASRIAANIDGTSGKRED